MTKKIRKKIPQKKTIKLSSTEYFFISVKFDIISISDNASGFNKSVTKGIAKKDEDKKLVQIKSKLEKLLSVKEKISRLQSKAQSIAIENLSEIKEEIKKLKNIKIS